MRTFKAKRFAKWATGEGLLDADLRRAIDEIGEGLVDAELGGGIVKKRVARHGEGKRGGFRTVVAYRAGARAFFIHGFAKSAKANVDAKELTALKLLAKTYFVLDDDALGQAVRSGALIDIGEA